MSERPARARQPSLCGTARGIASKKNESQRAADKRKPCGYVAIWACLNSPDCSRRMSEHRR
jgi:hypothetical protein